MLSPDIIFDDYDDDDDDDDEGMLIIIMMTCDVVWIRGDDIASAIYSDEEDEDYRMMDPGPRKKSTLRQWDFETKQDWERYMDQREATPKYVLEYYFC